MWKKTILTSFIALSLYSVPSSIAATQGEVNPTSTGDFDVTLTIPDRVRITGLADVNFGTYVSGDFDDDYALCVYSNSPTPVYAITASGDGAGSAFTLTNGTDTIPYNVFWNETAGTTVGELLLTATTKLGNRAGANQVSTNCATGGDSANLHVHVTSINMQGISNGTYTGTLTILIEPS